MAVKCEQAIFTSIRTLTGEGYRIIAASPGLNPDERTEITRRSPSHNSLCSPSSHAVGILNCRLDSGRYCIGYSRCAGAEQTARGGARVYTNLAVLCEDGFRRFEGNPVRAAAVLAREAGKSIMLKPQPRLDPLELDPDAIPHMDLEHDPTPCFGTSDDAYWLTKVLRPLLYGRSVLIVGASAPFEMLEWTLKALPLPIRIGISVSVGLRWASTRDIRLCFVDHAGIETRRAISGQGVEWLEVKSRPDDRQPEPQTDYCAMIGRWWRDRRFRDIVTLTGLIEEPASPNDLDHLAPLCDRQKQLVAAGHVDRDRLDADTLAWLNRTVAAFSRRT